MTVISGLALGIDAAAHAGALDGAGRTIAVLGCGIDRDYPRRNAALARRIASAGAIVSEWGPGVEPAPWRFPVRNRIVAALAQATVVVEATRRSGALITADHALALGRDVLAVPGAPWLDLGGGTLALLRAGAAPVGGAGDVLDALGVQMEVEPARGEPPVGRGRRALGGAPSPPAPPRRAGAGNRPRRGRRKRRTGRAGTRRPDRRGARRNPVRARAVPAASGKLVGPRGVAQLVERRSPKPKVAGSSPVAPVRCCRRKACISCLVLRGGSFQRRPTEREVDRECCRAGCRAAFESRVCRCSRPIPKLAARPPRRLATRPRAAKRRARVAARLSAPRAMLESVRRTGGSSASASTAQTTPVWWQC